MSFKDLSSTVDLMPGSESPLFGASMAAPTAAVPQLSHEDLKIIVRYLMANLSDDNDRIVAEDVMTRSLDCANVLSKQGDILVIREETTFDRDGNYLVALKYCEVVPKHGKGALVDTVGEIALPKEVSGSDIIGEFPQHDF